MLLSAMPILLKSMASFTIQVVPIIPKETEAERVVQTVKNLLKKGGDPNLALLAYRFTPLELGCVPSELLMGRKLSTTVSTADQEEVKAKDDRVKESYNHGVRDLSALMPGISVWVTDQKREGKVIAEQTPRSWRQKTGHTGETGGILRLHLKQSLHKKS